MMLLLDIGNTRVKWGRLLDENLSIGMPAVHHGQPLHTVWSMLWAALPLPRRVVVANVAGAGVAASLAAWCQAHWGVAPEFVASTATACGVSNGYHEPAQLGVDRWLALIGARHVPELAVRPLCVVGCGTALTVDVVDAGGRHLGGWIAPGLTLMHRQLEGGTAVLAGGIGVGHGGQYFGQQTVDAVTGGVQHAAAGLVLQAVSLAQRLLGVAPACVLTGGDAATLLPLLSPVARNVPDLVLHGLATWVQGEGAAP